MLSKAAVAAVLGLASLFASTTAIAACKGKFINPVTDVCWSCVMPITIAGISIDYTGSQRDMNSKVNDWICTCGTEIGVPLGFFEPARMVDITHNSYCMVGLGGVPLGKSGLTGWDTNGYVDKEAVVQSQQTAFYQAHLYANPLLYVLGLLMDSPCVEQQGYDVAYITEADPTWNDAELANLASPDSFLYGSLPAVLACGADCLLATTYMPSTMLHWCVGCQGTMYPFMGEVGHHINTIDSSSLVMTRMMAKMHRQGGAFGYYGRGGFCGGFYQPVMNKQQYKYSMTYPIPQTRGLLAGGGIPTAQQQAGAAPSGADANAAQGNTVDANGNAVDQQGNKSTDAAAVSSGTCCQPLGATTWLWGAGRYFPVEGEQYNYMLYRKRDCCQGIYGVQ